MSQQSSARGKVYGQCSCLVVEEFEFENQLTLTTDTVMSSVEQGISKVWWRSFFHYNYVFSRASSLVNNRWLKMMSPCRNIAARADKTLYKTKVDVQACMLRGLRVWKWIFSRTPALSNHVIHKVSLLFFLFFFIFIVFSYNHTFFLPNIGNYMQRQRFLLLSFNLKCEIYHHRWRYNNIESFRSIFGYQCVEL